MAQVLAQRMLVSKVHLFEDHVGELCQMLCLQLAMRAVLVSHSPPPNPVSSGLEGLSRPLIKGYGVCHCAWTSAASD